MPSIRLNKNDETFVEELVKSGVYGSADEMISAGLGKLREQDSETQRLLIQEGIDDIEAGRFHVYEIAEQFLADIRLTTDDD